MIFGMLAGEAAGFRMKGESLSSGGGVPVETEPVGRARDRPFLLQEEEMPPRVERPGKAAGSKLTRVNSVEAGTTGSEGDGAALDGLGSDLISAGLAGISGGPFICAVSGASGFKDTNVARLPERMHRIGLRHQLLDIFQGRGGTSGRRLGWLCVRDRVRGEPGRRTQNDAVHGGQRARARCRCHRRGFRRRGNLRDLCPSATGTGLIAGG